MILTNAIALLAYAATLWFILRRHPQYGVMFGFVSIMQLWTLLSSLYNDLGIYNFELLRYTETTLATTRLALLYIVFNFGFLWAARLLGRRRWLRRSYALKATELHLGNLKLAAYAAVALAGVFLVYSLYTDGIPLLLGLDRLAYLQEASGLDVLVVGYGGIIAFVLGAFRRKRNRFSVNGLILAALVIYAVLVGHKFSFIVLVLASYFTPVFARYVHDRPNFSFFRARYLAIGAGVLALFVTVAFGAYLRLTESFGGAGQLLTDRILAGQGEIWWATDYNRFQLDRTDPDHWAIELAYITGADDVASDQVGMRYLMVEMLGPAAAYALFDRGYLFTMAYPAIILATFSYWVAVLVQLAAGAVLFLLLHYLHFSLVYGHRLRAVIAFAVVLPLVTLLFTGNLFVFLTLGVVYKLLLLAAAETGLLVDVVREESV